MGLIENIVTPIVKASIAEQKQLESTEIEKASIKPAATMTEAQVRAISETASAIAVNTTSALPRSPFYAGTPFGPANPLRPSAINQVNSDGRADPRRYEYDVAHNINVNNNKPIDFKTLRASAEQIDILRRCLQVRRNKLTSLNWDIVISEAATEDIISNASGNPLKAMADARKKLYPEISRLRSFWNNPDPSNGLTFSDWFGIAIEEIDVIDALAIWPETTVGGEIRGLQILDGTTIKPLVDERGMRPSAPNPAFQQILYGFPRTEFSATLDDEIADGEYTSDQLTYLVRNRRSHSVYGLSAVEQALPIATLYLMRQQWLRAEFTAGTMPKGWVEFAESIQMTPDQFRQYESIFNDEYSGQLEKRNNLPFMIPGGTLHTDPGYQEKYSDALDHFFITSVTGFFGVLPTEIGFSAKGGMGASGHQEGEANAAESIGLIPTAKWFSTQLSNLSYNFLNMPRELEFRLMPSTRSDNKELAERNDIKRRNGSLTLNEARAEEGKPLIDTPEADIPLIVVGTNLFKFTNDGLVLAGADTNAVGEDITSTPGITNESKPSSDTEEPVKPVAPAQEEVKKFLKWIRKGNTKRPFEFTELEPSYAEILNKFVAIDDSDAARIYAEQYLGI